MTVGSIVNALFGIPRPMLSVALSDQSENTLPLKNETAQPDRPGLPAQLMRLLAELQQSPRDLNDIPRRIIVCQQALALTDKSQYEELWAGLQFDLGDSLVQTPQGNRAINLEQAIEAYNEALRIMTLASMPKEWADVMNNLATAYSFRIRGERAENLERAIAIYKDVLQIRTRTTNPVDWAGTMNNLAHAYAERIRGERAENLEQAIATYDEALQVITQDTMPIEWAKTLINLASAYRHRIRGERSENLEWSITAYHTALRIITRTSMPAEWSIIMMNLGNAYRNRILGEKAENIEQAISAYQEALQVRTRTSMPVDWATTMMNLANAYLDRIWGERAQNIEKAIATYQEVFQIVNHENMPVDWAHTMMNLAIAYSNRIHGEHAENIEQAIATYQEALHIITRTTMPVDWATIKNNLAAAHSRRIRGERAENIEQAITAYQEALQVRTREAMPVEWATTMTNLATAYSERIEGEHADNLEQAIACYQLALQVRQRATMPVEWAQTMMGLANTYRDRVKGERAENLEQAIATYQEALQVRTRATMPVEWATTVMNLANTYYFRIRGERLENIERAIIAYEAALTVQALSLLPADHQRTQRNLGNLLFGEQRWAAAQVAYQAAIQAGKFLLDTAYTELGRQAEVSEVAQLYASSTYCLWQLGQFAAAFQTLEQGKTRLLGQALALGEANLEHQPTAQKQAIHSLRQTIHDLEGEMRLPLDTPARRSDRELATSLQDARSQLRQLMQTVRAEQSDFMDVSLDVTAILSLIPEQGALVAPCLTSQGGFVFVIHHGCQEIKADQIIALPHLTEEVVLTWLQDPPDDPAWGGWLGAYSRQRLNPLQWHTTIQQTLAQVWLALMQSVYERLQSLGLAQGAPVILLPQGRLGLLPLHAAWREVGGQPHAFLDEYTVTYAASAYTLHTSQRRIQQTARRQNSLLMVVNPTKDLTYTPVEGDQVAARFPSTTAKAILKETAATEAAVVAAATGKAYLHFSCHGFYNWQNPVESGLLLAGNEIFTLADIIRHLDLGASRLVVLSACETGLTDIRRTPDEFVGLPAGFMQAGAPAVISTLWAVNDQSTSLLMDRFYQHHIQDNDPPAIALRKAQQWLRQVTRQEIGSYYFSYITRHMSAEDAYKLHGVITDEGDPNECPFAHPYYWAGFTYYGS